MTAAEWLAYQVGRCVLSCFIISLLPPLLLACTGIRFRLL